MQTIVPSGARTAFVLAVAMSLLDTLLCSPQSLQAQGWIGSGLGRTASVCARAFVCASQNANFFVVRSLHDTNRPGVTRLG
jgi:hypothetical protein